MRSRHFVSLFWCLFALTKPTHGISSPKETVSVVNIFGLPRHAHLVGPGYVPSTFIDRDLRLAFSGENWDQECLEAPGGDTTNGKLLHLMENCGEWPQDVIFRWETSGRILHSSSENRCLDLDDPEVLLDAQDLGLQNLVQFYSCDGGQDQQWVVLRDTSKIANVAKPHLCLSPLRSSEHDAGRLLVALNCRDAKDIGVTLLSK